MEMPVNAFKQSLKAGRRQIGLWCALASPYSTEICAGAGFDWLLIDTEHSPMEVAGVLAQLQAVAAYPVHAVVRPAWNDVVLIKRILDLGVQSLLIPYIETREQAEQAVAATRYPLQGVRGVAGATRASSFGRVKDYHRRANDEICVLLQVETRKGLDNLEAIANTEGVDGVFIGPSDLSAGLGFLGQPGHPEVLAAIDDAMRRIIKCGKAPGFLTPDEAISRRYIEQGCLFPAVGIDLNLLARGTEQLAARFKG